MSGLTSVMCALSLFAAAGEGSWAVVGLAGSGVWATDLERVEDGLRQSLLRAHAGKLQPRAATAALLNEARQAGLVCDVHDPTCAAKLGASASVDRVLVLDVSQQAPRVLVQAIVVDVAGETVVARAQRELDGAAPDPGVLDALARELVEPAKASGSIRVLDVPAGGRVLIDGAAPTTPVDRPIANVTPGVHVVEVSGPRGTWKAVVEVTAGAVTEARPVFPEAAPAHAAATHTAPSAPSSDASADAVATVEDPAAAFPLGPALAIGGGAALVLGAVGAGAAALALESPMDAGAREGVRAGGVALLGVAFVGAVVGAAGVGLWLMEDG